MCMCVLQISYLRGHQWPLVWVAETGVVGECSDVDSNQSAVISSQDVTLYYQYYIFTSLSNPWHHLTSLAQDGTTRIWTFKPNFYSAKGRHVVGICVGC